MDQVATKGTALEHSKLTSRLPAHRSLTQQPGETFQFPVFICSRLECAAFHEGVSDCQADLFKGFSTFMGGQSPNAITPFTVLLKGFNPEDVPAFYI